MKKQAVNPGNMSQVEMMNQYGQMSSASKMMRVGKGKRKYEIAITKKNKKLLAKLVTEMKKQMAGQLEGKQGLGMRNFLNYLGSECAQKTPIIKMSFEEHDFLKNTIASAVTEMDKNKAKWYSLIKKMFIWMTKTQYKGLLEELKK